VKFANASKLDRKSGVRLGERGAPVDSLLLCMTERFRRDFGWEKMVVTALDTERRQHDEGLLGRCISVDFG
jgi:hypothetical protein